MIAILLLRQILKLVKKDRCVCAEPFLKNTILIDILSQLHYIHALSPI